MVAVGPDEQRRSLTLSLALSLSKGAIDDRPQQRRAVASTPGIRIDDKLGLGRRDDRRGDLIDRQKFPLAEAEVDEALVGERRLAVGVARPGDEGGQPGSVRRR